MEGSLALVEFGMKVFTPPFHNHSLKMGKDKKDTKSADKGSGGKGSKGKGKADDEKDTKGSKGAQSINVRHILVSSCPQIYIQDVTDFWTNKR